MHGRKLNNFLCQYRSFTDIVGRVGGDEFLVLMKNVKSKEEVIQKAGELRKTLKNVIVESGISYKISVSIGISMIESNKNDYSVLL